MCRCDGRMVEVVAVAFCFFFFFSSRRRHTRCLSDWSSDVCSSDLGGAGFIDLNNDASWYTVLVYRLGHRLPLGPVALLLQPSWAPAIMLFGLAILLFPDGRVPSPRWRWVLGVYLAVGASWLAGAAAISADSLAPPKIQRAPPRA